MNYIIIIIIIIIIIACENNRLKDCGTRVVVKYRHHTNVLVFIYKPRYSWIFLTEISKRIMEVQFVEECVRQMLLLFSGPQYSGHSKRKDQVFWERKQTNKQQTLATFVHPFFICCNRL